jgi:predicted NBD/HSP70 family sugar kinase
MHLAADGAYFLGLKIGRRSADLVLVDFTGHIRASRRRVYRYPTPDAVLAFLAAALPAVTAMLPPAQQPRIGGIGVAMPFQLWSWTDHLGAPQSEMDAWRDRDIQAEIAAAAGLPTFIQNDATAACGAELVFGTGERPRDFLYFYFGYFIGGGLVLNGQLFTGRTGNAAGVGPMPVPGPDGRMRRLLTVASLSTLAAAMEAAGENPDPLWEQPDRWSVSAPVLVDWIEKAADGLASAILGATALLELDAVLIDGWMPAAVRRQITLATQGAFARLDLAGISPPAIREGSIGPQARTLGAAAVPLSQRYLLDPSAVLGEG